MIKEIKFLNDEEKELALRVLNSLEKTLEKEIASWRECEKRFEDAGNYNASAIGRGVVDGIGFSVDRLKSLKECIEVVGGVL